MTNSELRTKLEWSMNDGTGNDPRPLSIGRMLGIFAGDIKIAHTIFAMPFALLATFLAANGWPGWGKLGLIVLCMVTARTVAMAANRLLDARLDAINPRTARRAIPAGVLSRAFVMGMLMLCAAGFVGATALFGVIYHNWWPLWLSGPVLAFVGVYPLLKRFTRLCHYWLGAALGLAPVCAWLAISGHVAWVAVLLGGAVLFWTAGFDIIYACQDYASDLETGVVSVPAKIGIGKALWVARGTHVISAGLLAATGLVAVPLGMLYAIGVGIAVTLLVVEHWLVRADDLSKVGIAFMTVNGVISVVVGTLGIVDVFV